MTRDLAQDWLRTAQAAGAHGDVASAGARLLARWAEPHRHYHDVHHLRAVLDRVAALAGEADDLTSVQLAAWFHDAVYDARGGAAGEDEQRSADLAGEVLSDLRVDPGVVAEVRRLVLMTVTHAPEPDDRDGAVLSDADLGVLAESGADYDRYAAAVREEYAHVDDASFVAGRSAVLRSLLDRSAVFHTALGCTSWEAPARANLRRELLQLTTGR